MRFQFSIRSLLILSLAAGILAVLGRIWQHANANKEAVAELNRVGAEVYLPDPFEGDYFPSTPVKLKHLDPTGKCGGLRIRRIDSRDTLLAASRLSHTSKLTILDFAPEIGSAGCDFRHLRNLHIGGVDNRQMIRWVVSAPHLEQLSVTISESISREAIDGIANLPNLKLLRFRNTPITTEHIERMKRLTTIRFLGLVGCELEPGTLRNLEKIPGLRELELYGSQYSNEVLVDLVDQTQITSLDLSFSNLDDEGVAILSRFHHLRSLHLYGCQKITPACVPDLIKMQHLDHLNVLRTEVERDQQLQRAFAPKLQEWIM